MNDRFKFRVWNKEDKKMCEAEGVYGYTDENTNGGEVFVKGYKTSFYFPEEVEVMQCTGLKDKNGKLIYEGDIVNVKIDGLNKSYIPKVVVWDRKEWQLKQYNKNFKQNCSACEVKTKQKCQYCSQYFQTTGHTNFKDFYNNEVIGNIYENPELLQECE